MDDNDSLPEIEDFAKKLDELPDTITKLAGLFTLVQNINARFQNSCFKQKGHPDNDLIIYKEAVRVAFKVRRELLKEGFYSDKIIENYLFPTGGFITLEDWCNETLSGSCHIADRIEEIEKNFKTVHFAVIKALSEILRDNKGKEITRDAIIRKTNYSVGGGCSNDGYKDLKKWGIITSNGQDFTTDFQHYKNNPPKQL